MKVRAKFEVPEIIGGTLKLWAAPGYAHAPLFCKIFNGLLFAWTLKMYWPNLKSVALSIPEIIRGTLKLWAAPGYAHGVKAGCAHLCRVTGNTV